MTQVFRTVRGVAPAPAVAKATPVGLIRPRIVLAFAVFATFPGSKALAWDHPGHMTTAAIAFSEIEHSRPGACSSRPRGAQTMRDGRSMTGRRGTRLARPSSPPEARKLAEARHGKPTGQAIEALTLNAAVLSDPESKPGERALALSWVLHIVGDIQVFPTYADERQESRAPI